MTIGRLIRRREPGVAFLLVATVAAVSVVNPAFLTVQNLMDLLVQCAPAAIVSCAMVLVVVTGEIDISVGSLLGLLAVVMGLLASPAHAHLPVWIVVLATLGAGAMAGAFNGLLVGLARVPSIIVTLGMLTVLRGVGELLMGGEWITDLPPGLRILGTGTVAGVPICVWTAGLVVAVSIAFTLRTPLGRRIYAAGSNPAAARLAGLPLNRYRLLAFSLSGLLTAVAALVSVPQLSTIESGIGNGFELLVVTAVVVGGASIRGGTGTIAGAVLAVLLLGIIRTSLVFLNLGEMATFWERAVQGAFILGAVLVDHVARPGARGTHTGATP